MRGRRLHTLRWLQAWIEKHGRAPTGSEVAMARGLDAVGDLSWLRRIGLVNESMTAITEKGLTTLRISANKGRPKRAKEDAG